MVPAHAHIAIGALVVRRGGNILFRVEGREWRHDRADFLYRLAYDVENTDKRVRGIDAYQSELDTVPMPDAS